jgi:hypothetical protein
MVAVRTLEGAVATANTPGKYLETYEFFNVAMFVECGEHKILNYRDTLN